MTLVYKIMPRADYEAALAAGRLPPAPIDLRDGYVHLSTAEQAPETARLYFADAGPLVALAFEAAAMGAALRFEPSRGGALFPHYYGALDLRRVVARFDLAGDAARGFTLRPAP